MRTILLFALFCPIMLTNAQSYQWLKTPPITFASSPDMIGYVNACGASGSVYFAGFKEATYLYGSDIMGSLYFNKYAADGSEIFSQTFTGHGTVQDMSCDFQGNVLMAVNYVATITVGDLTLNTATNVSPLLLKFDSDGTLLWHYIPVPPQGIVGNFKAVTTDAAGNVYIGYDTFQNSYITKLSPLGVVDFTITQTNAERLTSVSVDTDGNIYAAGSCADPTAVYAGVAVPTNLTYNVYLVKYSPQGVYQWLKYINDTTCSWPQVKVNTPDQVYLCSHLYGAYTFDAITAEGPMSGNFNDFYLGKLDAAGNWQWIREVPGTGAVVVGHRNYLSVDLNGNAYVTGSSSGNINWGNGITSSSIGGTADAFIVKFSPQGLPLLAKTSGGTSQDRIDDVTATASGAVIVSGMTRGACAFDAISNSPADNTAYPFIAKLDNNLAVATQQLIRPSIYPNPVKNYIYFSNTGATRQGTIYDLRGVKIKDITVSNDTKVDIMGLAKGFYIIKADGLLVKFIKD